MSKTPETRTVPVEVVRVVVDCTVYQGNCPGQMRCISTWRRGEHNHECDACGHRETFDEIYPRTEYIPKEDV
jgi:hypothetical protein